MKHRQRKFKIRPEQIRDILSVTGLVLVERMTIGLFKGGPLTVVSKEAQK